MTHKLKFLILLNIVLLTGLVFSLWNQHRPVSANSSIQRLFAIDDTAGVDLFEIGGHKISRKRGNIWILDGGYPIQSSIVTTLFTVLQKLEVKTELNGEQNRKALEALQSEGIDFIALASGQTRLRYRFTTQNGENLATRDGKQAYSVFLPGVFMDMGRFFQVKEATWRENTLLPTSPRSLKSLTVFYPQNQENSFRIEWDSTFFKVVGVTALDSQALWNYLQYLPKVKAVEFLGENQSLRDSISRNKPLAEVTLEDLIPQNNLKLTVYALPSRMVGVWGIKNELVLLNFKQFNPRSRFSLLVNRKFFELKR